MNRLTALSTNSTESTLYIRDKVKCSNEAAFNLYSGNYSNRDMNFTNTTVSIVERSIDGGSTYNNLYGMVLGIGAHPTIGFKTKTSTTDGLPSGVIN